MPGLAVAALMAMAGGARAADADPPTHPCRIEGMPNELQCGQLRRPLDPARPAGTQIEIHYMIVPAMARNKQPDPVLLLAGGPGQSAIDIAPLVLPRLARLNNRRDLVFIDQRGTGRSAPLQCADESRLPIKEALDPAAQFARMKQCALDLARLPHGDLRFYTTTIAMQDFEAVRQRLGVPQWNLVGASYGTRAALEYQRQFPHQVRRTVMDGVAPPDMALPASFSTDSQAALDEVFASCEQDREGCARRYPALRRDWAALLAGLPREVTVQHPLSGEPERFTLRRELLMSAVRVPLYAPALAAGLPAAITAAAAGRYEGLFGLANTLGGSGKAMKLAAGMHFSVICAEDLPRLEAAGDRPGADFAEQYREQYRRSCRDWPRGEVAPDFYTIPPAQTPVLLLSGGADPATPPRHGERVAKALGARAQHIVVPQAGHGVLSIACMRDVLFRFIDAKSDAAALPQDAACATRIPRPPAFQPVQPGASSSRASS
ncbi:alpha/beta hydrolase [Roseateles violae]|uniref:Alpha/beta hydrolase n=1 Tax=Roseateles violae TaxID=3058042 RepID=A0ABT8DLE0_9BURK|nr:alpha/beta hydrolase [Pelomonas sp. PFR6]MDN3919235.1 alpha/beta hydrolase [Pelomonas sp. PFR6]